MDTSHLPQFSEWFNVLAITHRLRIPNESKGRMQAEYFDVLRPYPVEAVQSAYDTLRHKMKKWPVPADWLEALPPFGNVARLPLATPEEIAENDTAEKLGYEAEKVCRCQSCEAAGCSLPPRYVPRLNLEGGVIERRHPAKHTVPIILGRWLHGDDLKRWYITRARFYELKNALHVPMALSKKPEDRAARLATEARAVVAETKAS